MIGGEVLPGIPGGLDALEALDGIGGGIEALAGAGSSFLGSGLSEADECSGATEVREGLRLANFWINEGLAGLATLLAVGDFLALEELVLDPAEPLVLASLLAAFFSDFAFFFFFRSFIRAPL